MIRINIFIFIVCVILVSHAGTQDYFNDLPKCELKNQECFRKLYEHIVQGIGEKGWPNLDIPPVDPIQLKNATVSLLGLLDITMVKGFAAGVRSCVFDKFMLNLTEESGYQENTCSIKVEGKYKLRPHSSVVKKFFGSETIQGDGNGKVSVDNVHLKFNFPVYAQKRNDGEIYMNVDYKSITYDFQVLGGAKFFADNIYMGDKEISKKFVPFLNENWKFVMNTFGRAFINKAIEFYFELAGKFFDVVPAKYYIKDDLTSYARL